MEFSVWLGVLQISIHPDDFSSEQREVKNASTTTTTAPHLSNTLHFIYCHL